MIENNKSNTPKNKSKLLLDSNPLIILPELAVLIGLNESIILQQIHYWLQKSTHIFDGRVWVYNSIPQWCEQFPFWSEKTIKRAIGTLRNQGLLITGNYNDLKQDRTLWYTIDYAVLEALQQQPVNPPHSSSGQNDPMEETEEEEPVNPRKYSSGQNDPMRRSNCPDDQPNLGRPLPEITSKITSKKINPSVSQNENLTDGRMDITPDERELRELERILKNGQVDFYHTRLFIENVIKKLYINGQMPYILKMGLTHTDIQDRLRLLTHTHIDWALAKMSNVKSNKELYFAKCLLTAIVEVDVDDFIAMSDLEDDDEPMEPEKSRRSVGKGAQRDNFDQRSYTDEELEGLYANLADKAQEEAFVCKETAADTLPYTRFVEVEQPVCEAYPNPFLGTPAPEQGERAWQGEYVLGKRH